MKKKLESELISIAHRVLKLKNREETKQLHEEAKKLYEQLTILRFYEENFEAVKTEIPTEILEEKLEAFSEETVVEQIKEEIIIEAQTKVETEKETVIEVKEELAAEAEVVAEVTEIEKPKSQPALFDSISADDYKDLDFVRVDDVPKEVEQVAETTFETVAEPVFEAKEIQQNLQVETKIETTTEVLEEEPKSKSLNDRLNKGINFGLNDRIAFEKKLFGGNPDDMNRVLSQLNTFESFDEAKGFIDAFVKPDYNNWEGKEEYETRFLDIVEKKFS